MRELFLLQLLLLALETLARPNLEKAVHRRSDRPMNLGVEVFPGRPQRRRDGVATRNHFNLAVLPNKKLETMRRERRQAVNSQRFLWNSARLYYYFDPSASSTLRSAFTDAVSFWHESTCIDFEENPMAVDRVRVIEGPACSSPVGRVGGEQNLSLSESCQWSGTAIHELGHALGFYHTMSRWDRDNFVEILFQNIAAADFHNFELKSTLENNNFDLPFDMGSVMMYTGHGYSKNGEPTMLARDDAFTDTMGSGQAGFVDVLMMNLLYNCHLNCANTVISCQNGGFLDSRDCSKCRCPTGFGGLFCEQRTSGCGETLQATSEPQNLTIEVGNSENTIKSTFIYCTTLIQAPKGTVIELTIRTIYAEYTEGCIYRGIELKTKADPRLSGYRFCSLPENATLLAETNVVPVIAFSRFWGVQAVVEYRFDACPPFGHPTFGHCNANDTTANCTCFPGFSTSSPTIFTCDRRTRTWSGEPPTCSLAASPQVSPVVEVSTLSVVVGGQDTGGTTSSSSRSLLLPSLLIFLLIIVDYCD